MESPSDQKATAPPAAARASETRMLRDPDRAAAGRAQAAMLRMRKIEIAELEAAFNGS